MPFQFDCYKGMMAAGLTTMSDDGMQCDFSDVNKYANDLLSQGITGNFLNGTSGQSICLTTQERMDSLDAWMNTDAVKSGKLTMLPHIGGNSINEIMQLADHAASVGAYGIGIMPPGFLRPENHKAAARLLIEVAHRHPTLPVYYYHFPRMTGVDINMTDALVMARQYAPNVVGAKFTDSLFSDLQRSASKGFTTLVGADDMISYALAAGTHGCIGITCNMFGRIAQDIYEAFEAGDRQKADDLQKILASLFDDIKKSGNVFATSYYLTEKLRGLHFGSLRYPQYNLSSAQKDHVDRWLQNYAQHERYIDPSKL